ncbi:hypothetical protein D9M71_747580 [compost metagenome]
MRAALRHDGHHADLLENAQGLANRTAADLEVVGQFLFTHRIARPVFTSQNRKRNAFGNLLRHRQDALATRTHDTYCTTALGGRRRTCIH